MDNNNTKLDLTIRSKQGVIFKGTVEAVSSYNEKGVFDILPQHGSFISLIKQNVVIHKDNGQKETVKIDNGVLRVFKNSVNIYVGV